MSTVANLYDEWHTRHYVVEDDEPTPTAPWHELVKPVLGDISGLDVLEAGCGPGPFARYLADQGAHVTGCDISEVAVGIANRLMEGHGEAVVADLERLPFPDASFDMVASLEALEHLQHPRLGMIELVRVLKPGGRLILTGPNYLNLVGLYRIALRLVGKRFTEMEQPVNQPLMLFEQVRRVRELGCRVTLVRGTTLLVPLHIRTLALPLPPPQSVFRWFAMHTLIVAERPS